MNSVRLCFRNDLIADSAVIVVVAAAWLTGCAWLDVVVGIGSAVLFAESAVTVPA